MKIRSLPLKKQITFFEVQYFVNEGKQGKAKNVLAVTYSTHPNRLRAKNDKSVQHREYFDLTCGREINRKTKKYFGTEMSDEIKQSIKSLKTEHDITTMFGIRQVRYKLPHKTIAGKWFHKRQLDINNLVFVHIAEDKFTAKFSWEGEEIAVDVKPHRGALSNGQSVGVGYYTTASTDAELAERMLELKSAATANSFESDTKHTTADEAPNEHDDAAVCVTTDIPEQVPDSKTKYLPPNDSVRPASITQGRIGHRKKYVQRTDDDVFQEMCRNSVYGDTTEPTISLGLSFQFPSDRVSTGASAS